MIAELVTLARSRGLRKLFSLALPPLIGVYRDLGFRQERLLKSHFASGEDVAVMRLHL